MERGVKKIININIKHYRLYYCEGYMDDDQWSNCSFISTEIERNEWKEEQ